MNTFCRLSCFRLCFVTSSCGHFICRRGCFVCLIFYFCF
ncbi:hypothetical protein WZ342_2270 [Enterococcus faecalis]|nr:hypothetical protein WZ342_2270 [Enterococcus faecalis]